MSTQSWGSQNPKRSVDVSSSLAIEAKRIVRHAAEPVPAGETVKGQLRRACRALGYPDSDWRISDAWYGRAGSWSAAAFEQLRSRYSVWRERQAKGAEAEMATLRSLYVAMAGRLEANDEGFHREDIVALLDMARRLGGPDDGAVK